jgi:hypothetical protein
MNPVLVSLEYPPRRYRSGDELPIGIWVINDLPTDLNGCELEILLWGGTGETVARHTMDVEIEATSARKVDRLLWTLPLGDDWRLTCKLYREGRILSINEYDLTVHDDIVPTLQQRMRAWLRSLVIPS